MERGSEEIRINDIFTSRITSTYKSGNKDSESAPNVRLANVRTDNYIDKIIEKINQS